MKSKRKLKGMTLIEVVISIGIYAVIALLLTEIMSLVNATMKATGQLNRRLAYEAKFADNMLISDGKNLWAERVVEPGDAPGKSDVTVRLRSDDAVNSFNIEAKGSEYMTNADNLERASGRLEGTDLIIHKDTNYRFMVFTKEIRAVDGRPDIFRVHLDMVRDSSHTGMPLDVPITKIIVRGPAFKIGEETGDVFTEQTITDRALTGIDDQNPISISPSIETKVDAGRLLDICVPQNIAGVARDQTGTIEVLVFTYISDDAGHRYLWYEPSHRSQICPLFKNLDYNNLSQKGQIDALDNISVFLNDTSGSKEKSFPSSAYLKLDFNFYEHNLNTDSYSYYEDITYTWHVDADGRPGNPILTCEAVHLS